MWVTLEGSAQSVPGGTLLGAISLTSGCGLWMCDTDFGKKISRTSETSSECLPTMTRFYKRQ